MGSSLLVGGRLRGKEGDCSLLLCPTHSIMFTTIISDSSLKPLVADPTSSLPISTSLRILSVDGHHLPLNLLRLSTASSKKGARQQDAALQSSPMSLPCTCSLLTGPLPVALAVLALIISCMFLSSVKLTCRSRLSTAFPLCFTRWHYD
jgi:hypothetical protein